MPEARVEVIGRLRRSRIFSAQMRKVVSECIRYNQVRRSAVLFGLCLYPFLLTSILVLGETKSSYMALRLASAMAFNSLFFGAFLIIAASLPRRAGNRLLRAMWAYLLVFTVASSVHFALYRQLIGMPTIYALLDTTWQESAEYVSFNYRPRAIAVGVLLALPLFWAVVASPPVPRIAGRERRVKWFAVASLALVATTLASATRAFLHQNNPVLLGFGSVWTATAEKALVRRLQAEMPLDDMRAVRADRLPATHVLVIGESTTRRHMSLYGYGRETNPRLSKRLPDLAIALDACSSRGSTVPQLKELLTFASREDPSPLYSAPSLLQIMNRAGFKVFWLSNQQMAGSFDRWSAVLAQPADVKVFVNKRGFEEGVSLDARLIPPFRQALSDGAMRRFIIVHLLGTHHGYDLRYPIPEFSRFRGRSGADPRFIAKNPNAWQLDRYNAYDNAVLYNDLIVDQLIEELGGVERATLTYLSDHGEALGETSDFFGHIDGPGPKQIYEIPILFHMSGSMQREMAERLGVFHANLARPLQSDHLIHSLLSLYGLDYPLHRGDKDLFSRAYTPPARYCDGLKP